MEKSAGRIQGVGKGEFVDEKDADLQVQTIPSGRGRVEARSTGAKPLEPELLCAEDGRLGWRVRLPRGLPLATPAVIGDSVFLGGGFGSHEVYAFDAGTGALRWQLRTGDGVPSSPVAGNGERHLVRPAELGRSDGPEPPEECDVGGIAERRPGWIGPDDQIEPNHGAQPGDLLDSGSRARPTLKPGDLGLRHARR